jgi:predicted phosphodiesterase
MNKFFALFILISVLLISMTPIYSLVYNEIFNQSISNNFEDKIYSKPNSNFTSPQYFLRIVVMADTHLNFSNANLILKKVSDASPNLIVHLGDHTDFGDKNSLVKAKEFLDSFKIPYYSLPGDRDIAQSQNLNNFSSIFGSTFLNNYLLEIKGIKIFFFSNMYNFTPFNEDAYSKIMSNIDKSDVIFSSQPIYVPDTSMFKNKYMGSDFFIKNYDGSNLDSNYFVNMTIYNNQSNKLLDSILKRDSPLLIVSGDHHKSSNFTHPSSNVINFHVVGALAENIESGSLRLKQTALQSKRFSIIDFYENLESKSGFIFSIREIEIID